LIFSPEVQLIPDEEKTRFKSVYIRGNELFLDFYITKKDIEQINEIRSLFQNFFIKRNIMSQSYQSLWEMV